MKTIFDDNDYADLVKRINNLQHSAPALWGKMDVAQMLAHCNGAMKVAVGDLKLERNLVGKILGPLFKKSFLSEKPFSRNSPTAKEFVMVDPKDFAKEKEELLSLTKRFHDGGEQGATKHPHSFVGEITPQQWGESQWKHLDHHLRQFGV
jgi:hypothetical protein